MKKLFLVVFALLLMVGVANATNIPQMVDPKNYPTVWTELVYNGSGSTIQSATIVEWDFDTSDVDENQYDDMCSWVKVANGASDIWTAGVVPWGKTIANGDVGAIVIRGPTFVLEYSTSPAANEICATSADGGVTTDAASANTKSLGVAVNISPSVGPMGSACSGYSIVFVDMSYEAD
jgi:hypothetical protein